MVLSSPFLPLRYSTPPFFIFFSFNDTAPPSVYTLSLHDALPISGILRRGGAGSVRRQAGGVRARRDRSRRSEEHRLNSSHRCISYAVFCLKKKKIKTTINERVE